MRGRVFPFKFRWESCARPSGIGIPLKIAQMSYGFGFVYRTQASQSKIPPSAITLDPVKRCIPTLLVDGVPAEGKPKLRAPVSTGLYEIEVFAVGDKTVRKRKRMDQSAMLRAFIIIRKPISLVSDGHDRFIEIKETWEHDRSRFGRQWTRSKNRIERVLREDVFDVRE